MLVSGYSFRSDAAAITELGRLLGCPIKAVQLVDPRLYHLDLTFCPLDDRRAICAPSGWDRYGRKVIEALVPEPLWLEEDEALSFCANSVVVGTTIVMPSTPAPRRPPARGLGLHGRREPGRRVPQGRRRLPLPHPLASTPSSPVRSAGPSGRRCEAGLETMGRIDTHYHRVPAEG